MKKANKTSTTAHGSGSLQPTDRGSEVRLICRTACTWIFHLEIELRIMIITLLLLFQLLKCVVY